MAKTRDFADVIRAKMSADPDLKRRVDEEHAKVEAFNKHMDQCRRCHDNPFDLCPAGAGLLAAIEE